MVDWIAYSIGRSQAAGSKKKKGEEQSSATQ